MTLEVQKQSWFQLNGPSKFTLNLAPGEVTSRSLTFTALEPGRWDMTVTAIGSTMSDAVERSIRIEPDGKRFDATFNGRIGPKLAHNFEVPAKAIDGASNVLVRLTPGAFGEVVGGIDSLLRLPDG